MSGWKKVLAEMLLKTVRILAMNQFGSRSNSWSISEGQGHLSSEI